MANVNPTSYYFTIVVYPQDMKTYTIFRLHNLGTVFVSPIHCKVSYIEHDKFLNQDFYVGKHSKEHQHVLIKCSNKITENAFIQKLCSTLNNDFTGVALHKGDSLVRNPYMMIRYFYHLDNPLKESFDIEDAFQNTLIPKNMTQEVVKALNLEITQRISFAIQSGEIHNIQELLTFYCNSHLLVQWLYSGKNMYVVNSMFNEIRRMKV